jgi:3-deoxy-D-manno-octulosonic-acid transferase
MSYPVYNIFVYALSPIIWIYFLYRGFKDKRYWSGLGQRLGLVDKLESQQTLHLHCASVGESIAAIPLILQLQSDFPNMRLWITTTSPTGRVEVLKIIKTNKLENTLHSYLPIDWLGSVNRFIERVKPCVSILMETEIWPNLTRQLNRHNIPVILANARLSSQSLDKYLKRARFSKQLFAKLSLVAAQYPSDAENFSRLGVAEENIEIVGSSKFDIQISQQTLSAQQAFAKSIIKNRRCWIAASIHPDEFDDILECHRSLLNNYPDLILIAVPRHPEAFAVLQRKCMEFEFINKSNNRPVDASTQILIGDTMGEMTIMCGAADIAFVGGSLISRGGHNPLEPAACGIPVAIGPSHYNFNDVCQIMQSSDTLTVVKNHQELAQFIVESLSNKSLLAQQKLRTQQLFEQNSGSALKISQAIAKQLSNS